MILSWWNAIPILPVAFFAYTQTLRSPDSHPSPFKSLLDFCMQLAFTNVHVHWKERLTRSVSPQSSEWPFNRCWFSQVIHTHSPLPPGNSSLHFWGGWAELMVEFIGRKQNWLNWPTPETAVIIANHKTYPGEYSTLFSIIFPWQQPRGTSINVSVWELRSERLRLLSELCSSWMAGICFQWGIRTSHLGHSLCDLCSLEGCSSCWKYS